MMTQCSTVCTIEYVRNGFPPALADVRLSSGEVFPVFDASVLIDVKLAEDQRIAVLPLLAESRTSRTIYLRGLRPVDVLAAAIPCLDCRRPMPREVASATNGNVDQFVCPNCSRRVYIGPPRPAL